MTRRALLDRASRATTAVADPAELLAAIAQLDMPWRTTVIGRRSVGKSTLVNAVLGRPASPVGLGGVTDAPALFDGDGWQVVDTPGLEDERRALEMLQPLLEQTDAVVWIVDGLQPVTMSERRIMTGSLVTGTPLHVVVSRLDLAEQGDVPAVLRRVEVLARAFAPTSVRRLDLRALPLPGAEDALRWVVEGDAWTSPRRLDPIRLAVTHLRDQVLGLPSLPGRAALGQQLRARWTATVRATQEQVSARIHAGAIDHKGAARAALSADASAAAAAWKEELLLDPVVSRLIDTYGPPDLPVPDAPARGPLGEVVSALSGREGALRILRAEAARWLAEGELALLDWLDQAAELDEDRTTRQDALDALDAALAALR